METSITVPGMVTGERFHLLSTGPIPQEATAQLRASETKAVLPHAHCTPVGMGLPMHS